MKKLLYIIEEALTTILWLGVTIMMLYIGPAGADGYAALQVGDSKYKKNDIWEQLPTGYESVRGLKGNAWMLSYTEQDVNWFGVPSDFRAAIKDYGQFTLGALWGDPDNPLCHTCSPTTSSHQTGTVQSIGLAWQPKYQWAPRRKAHLTIGAELYDAEWQAHFFHALDANQQARVYSGSAIMKSTGITGTLGVGARWDSLVVDFEYAAVNVEGKGQKWGGGGAYEGATIFVIGIVKEF